MDSNWRFFGYDIARLRQDVYVNQLRDLSGHTFAPEAPIYPTTYSGYWNVGKPADEQSNEPRLHSDAQTPAPGDERAESLTIDQIRDQIMGEQPSTTSDRATQWYNVESMLFHLQSELFSQTDSLEAEWESPSAKDAYLRKVGETLAHIEVWREAADANHQGLALLAGAMRRAQTKMEELWQRYTDAIWQATDDYMNMPTAYGPNPQRGFKGEMRTLIRQDLLHRYDLPYIKEARERYNQEARELISETADSYAPAISKLESARARRMNPMNAILHPEASGIALDLPPVESQPLPPALPQAFNSMPPSLRASRPPAPQATGAMFADRRLSEGALRPQGVIPTSPEDPVAFTRGSVAVPPSHNEIRSLQQPRGGIDAPIPSPFGPAVPPALVRGFGNTPPAPPPAIGAPTANVSRGNTGAPGTIMPPPSGGVPPKPSPKGKTLGRKDQSPATLGLDGSGQVPPPPGGSSPSSKDERRTGTTNRGPIPPTSDNAFHPPPASPSILDTKRNTKRRARSGTPADVQTRAPAVRDATPPVLFNARVESKVGGVPRRERPARATNAAQSEFAVNVPVGTVPVFEGGLAEPRRQPSQQPLGDVPIALRGSSGPASIEQAANADRAIRSWEAGTSGGSWDVGKSVDPVVSSDKPEGYRAEPKALGT